MSKNNTHLTIVARPQGGFRRAGFQFEASKPKHIALADLDDAQIAQLKAEPNLVCIETNGDGAAQAVQSDVEVDALKKTILDLESTISSLKGDLEKAQAAEKELEAQLKDRIAEIKKLETAAKGSEASAAKKS